MAADSQDVVAHVQLVDRYRFTATFPGVVGAQPITLDEAPPLGEGAGPTPAGLLAAAIGGCLSASLTLCLNKAKLEPDAVNAHVTAHIARNADGRLRIEGMDVDLTPCFAGGDEGRFERCKALYQDFCIVTESVRRGIPVHVHLAQCGEDLKRCA
jgi:organic hydroperoxide reductase OsmC/OhrA